MLTTFSPCTDGGGTRATLFFLGENIIEVLGPNPHRFFAKMFLVSFAVQTYSHLQ